ncbi:MAG TPA: amino acid permease, partial [Gemmatimonadaceae bacterium]|nr:amino acid permease [Gemmatimonadaceae bacterium]
MPLFVRKDLGSLLAEAGSGTLRRELGPLALVTLGIGAVIGAGIFVLTGNVASQHTGPALTLSMVLAGIACGFAGLCYAELASMIPVAGSAYTYAYATMGELVAWIIGWDLVLEYSLSSSTVAVGWSAYAVTLLSEIGITVPPRLTSASGSAVLLADGSSVPALFNLPAVVICLALTALLVIGIRESARVNTTIVIIKVAVLALFVGVGAHYINTANLHPFIPPNTGEFGSFGWSGILRGAGIIFFAYIGFDAVSTASQEAKNPGRDIPIGILVSLAICTIIYIAVGVVMTGLVPYASLNVASPIAVAVQATGLGWLPPIINIGAICGLSSVILVNMLAQSRIFYSMSRDGLLPPLFSRLHRRFRTPHVTTAITGFVVAIASGLFPIGVLGQLVSMGTLLAFAIVCAGVLILRRTEPNMLRPFK